MTGLTLADITDPRSYERERDDFRREVIALKKLRRIGVGPIVTIVLENRTTIRFQIQEMARAEKLFTDEQIAAELAIYNPLVPGPGDICITMFIELTNESQLREWLPKLVGIERSLYLGIGGPGGPRLVAELDEAHEAQLTRDAVTASVHYLRIRVPEAHRDLLVPGPAVIGLDHPAYAHEVEVAPATLRSVAADWAPAQAPR
ncbi:MAG TPA: DUF3501 family protein [Acidimicrobiales bacterium]|nr:DUF3501 family protein [Acidimicrobiales bacterium]